MLQAVGSTTVYMDPSTGDLLVDPNAVSGEDEGGSLFGGNPARRFQRKYERLKRRAARRGIVLEDLDDDVEPEVEKPIQDLYQHAVALGVVTENQFEGLGFVSIAATTAGFISDTVNRNLWGKGIVLDSDDPPSMTITAITVAGLPINVGAAGAPLSMFQHNSTRFGITFGRRIALVGQVIRVDAFNNDSSAHSLSGAVVADEMNPYMQQALWERLLVQAAVEAFGG